MLAYKRIHCDKNKNGLRAIKIEDLSLYKDVVMVSDRIWAPTAITQAFFNNLLLGHRAPNMMKRLAQRSVYWHNMAQDIEDLFNECQHCQDMNRRNKKPEDLPEEETTRPYECISMDSFKTDAGEWALAIIDKHTGFVWCRKTGTTRIGTADKIEQILDETMGPNIFLIKKFKTDRAGNLTESNIEDLSRKFGIWQDTSSAYHPAGNKLIESTVGRIKRVLGKRRIEDAMRDINALNLSQPYTNKLQTPNEEMTGRPSPVAGIPVPDHIYNGKIPADRITKGEYKGTNPALKPTPLAPTSSTDKPESNPAATTDTDPDTALENSESQDWEESTSELNPKQTLNCGDRVFYIDFTLRKGPRRWRAGIIIQRKQEYYYSHGRREAHGYDIYDVENCTHVTRTRKDIRKYKPGKMERKVMEQINKNLGEIRTEFYKNEKFISEGVHAPPEFELKGYNNEPLIPIRPTTEKSQEKEPHREIPEPIREKPTEQLETPDNNPTEATRAAEPEPPAPPSVQPTAKVPRALARLTNNLDGINWNCGPLPERRRYVAASLDLYQTPGIHEGSHENTEPVPDEEAGPPPEEYCLYLSKIFCT